MCAELLGELVKTPRTMAEQVYDLLRERILQQEILPGERLLEIAVSESLNVSRTPVRESFRLLQQLVNDTRASRSSAVNVKRVTDRRRFFVIAVPDLESHWSFAVTGTQRLKASTAVAGSEHARAQTIADEGKSVHYR